MFSTLSKSFKIRLFAGVSVSHLLSVLPAIAEERPDPAIFIDPIIVSATRNPTPESRVGSSVTLVTAEEIAQKQQRTLVDVLREVPGLTVVQNGNFGGAASVFIRGAENRHTKMLIDGIDVSDPAGLGVDFSQFLSGDIDRIEVLRGPQSGLYGSDAIGGVINIVTKKGEGPLKFTGKLEGGSFGAFNQAAGASGSEGRFNYNFNVAHNRMTSSRVMPGRDVPPGFDRKNDLADNLTLSTRLGAELSDTVDVDLVGRYIDTNLDSFGVLVDYGAFPAQAMGTIHNYSDSSQYFTRGSIHHAAFDGAFDHTFGLAYGYNRRSFASGDGVTDVSYYKGERYKADWQGNLRIVESQMLSFGGEAQREEADSITPWTGSFKNDVKSYAGFVQLQSDWADRFANTLSLRYDDHQGAGDRVTYRVAPVLLIPETGTKLKASLGTGFKAPSLDQLYHTYGTSPWITFANPNLKPERSLGYDVGFEQTIRDVRFGATWFHNDIKNMIKTIQDTAGAYHYVNLNKAATEGVEAFVAFNPVDNLQIRADYTYTDARNDETHVRLDRRPLHKASLSSILQATDKLSLSASLIGAARWTDKRWDLVSGEGGTVKGEDYVTVNLAGEYAVSDNFSAFARVTNLFDKRVENPAGYDQAGIGAFGGVKISF